MNGHQEDISFWKTQVLCAAADLSNSVISELVSIPVEEPVMVQSAPALLVQAVARSRQLAGR